MRSFSKRLTRRIVLALMLMMAVVTVFILGVAISWMIFKTRYYYQALMDVENETIEKELYSVETAMANSIDEVEEHIAAARRFYNSAANELKNAVEIFPSSLVAGMCGISAVDFFRAEEQERKSVNAQDYLK